MNKLVVICGPTATGKTALGIRLAKKFNGEIVSADSRQVYKGMDIGTGKDLPANAKLKIKNEKLKTQIKNKKTKEEKTLKPYRFQEIPIWLLDIVEPDYRFSVADYVKCANLVIKDIWERRKLPIMVGGTGFYIKGVVEGIETIRIKPDWRLRKKLSNYPIVKLSNLLKNSDRERWKGMNKSDRNNPRRLIRAIEIAKHNQKSNRLTIQRGLARSPIPSHRESQSPLPVRFLGSLKGFWGEAKGQNFCDKVLFIGLTAPREILYQRIDERVEKRVKKGIVREIEGLLRRGYTWENSVLGETIGYCQWKPYFRNSKFEIRNSKLREEIIQRWKHDEHGYARRQMTWFRKVLRSFDKTQDELAQDKELRRTEAFWFDISQKEWENKVTWVVQKWIR